MLVSVSVALWRAWKSLWERMRSHVRAHGLRVKKRQGEGMCEWGSASCHLLRRMEWMKASVGSWVGSLAPRAMGDFNHPITFWQEKRAGHRESWRFLKGVKDKFLT